MYHTFRNETIPIILDDFVDMKFGTGVVKITPAHSKIDYDVAKRHNLPLLQVIGENGCMQNAGQFNKLHRYDCREKILRKLNEIGLLRKKNPHEMSLPFCSRTGDVIEYLPKEQWFLSCSELNRKAASAVLNGHLRIIPEKFINNWLNWTDNDKDWCISRQLWWGHQIPAYKCSYDNKSIWIAACDEESAIKHASKDLHVSSDQILVTRDTDVLDTWFSSGIYPFSSLGWPDSTVDYNNFYPLNLMTTGHDILGFWVHRMVILGLELTDKLPFNNILLHGIICDNKGAKMSKSKGNVIDPIDIINGISLEQLYVKTKEMHENGILNKNEFDKATNYHKTNFSNRNGIPECGVDALRFTLLSYDTKSHYINFDVDLCYANKLFCNKIWQSIKYIELSLEKLREIKEEITIKDLTYFDKWILSRASFMVNTVNKSMDEYDFHIATRAIRSFIYNEYCDIYLEATKPGFDDVDAKVGYAHAHTLIAVLNIALRCLVPYMIYVTAELIPKIPAFERNVIFNFDDSNEKHFKFPLTEDFVELRNEPFEKQVENVLNAIFLIRQIKGFYGIPNKPRPKISIKTSDDRVNADININFAVMQHLARCGEIELSDETRNKQYVSGLLNKDTVISVEFIGEDVDKVVEIAKSRLKKKIKKVEEGIVKLEYKFLSSNYLNTVPEWTQNLDKEKILNKKEELKQLHRLIML